jgi:hypothetical protein
MQGGGRHAENLGRHVLYSKVWLLSGILGLILLTDSICMQKMLLSFHHEPPC